MLAYGAVVWWYNATFASNALRSVRIRLERPEDHRGSTNDIMCLFPRGKDETHRLELVLAAALRTAHTLHLKGIKPCAVNACSGSILIIKLLWRAIGTLVVLKARLVD